MPTIKQYGLLIEKRMHYGTEYIIARIVRREVNPDRLGGYDHPIGCSSEGERSWDNDTPKNLIGTQLDGLESRGFVSTFNGGSFLGYEPEFHDIHSADMGKINRMKETLRRVQARKVKDHAYEAGDALVAFANALKLSFVVKLIGKPGGSNYADSKWNFMGILEGRDAYRRMIEESREEVAARLKEKASA